MIDFFNFFLLLQTAQEKTLTAKDDNHSVQKKPLFGGLMTNLNLMEQSKFRLMMIEFKEKFAENVMRRNFEAIVKSRVM
jgi:hypothetical protein